VSVGWLTLPRQRDNLSMCSGWNFVVSCQEEGVALVRSTESFGHVEEEGGRTPAWDRLIMKHRLRGVTGFPFK
jgi:hypothetical protein